MVSTLLFTILLLAFGAVVGAGAIYFLYAKKTPQVVVKDATVLLERIEKVFKVVMAEGYFSEIYTFEDQKKWLYYLSDNKKALIIAKAKVLVGFDFMKVKIKMDETTKRMVIEAFPPPEVLSIDTDYKFYDIEHGWLNRFNPQDYTNLLNDAKQQMNDKALQSDLPRIANNQIQFMVYQLAASMNWEVEMRLTEANQRQLESYTQYKELVAEPKQLLAGESSEGLPKIVD